MDCSIRIILFLLYFKGKLASGHDVIISFLARAMIQGITVKLLHYIQRPNALSFSLMVVVGNYQNGRLPSDALFFFALLGPCLYIDDVHPCTKIRRTIVRAL